MTKMEYIFIPALNNQQKYSNAYVSFELSCAHDDFDW